MRVATGPRVRRRPAERDYVLPGQPQDDHGGGSLSFNGDARSNQDYEVRFANNSSAPGAIPDFSEKAQLTTGDRILGKDHGGFHTRFRPERRTVGSRKV